MKSVRYSLIILMLAGVFAGCSSGQSPSESDTAPVITKMEMPGPFHFQKTIEVKPGLIFDIITWGRGADSTKAYLILRSDSTHRKFNSSTGELEGEVQDVWNMDMDADGRPEIFVQTKDSGHRLNLYIHEFDDSGNSQKIRFPDLSDATKKTYGGNDSLYVKDGKLIREFPVVEADSAKTPAGKKTLIYSLAGNDFSVVDPNAKPEPPKPKKTVVKKRSRRR